MQGVLVVGRILFVLVFLVNGAQGLMSRDGAADVKVPAALSSVTEKISAATGLSTPKLLAIVGGAVQLIGGLLIVFGIGTRFAALILIVYFVVVSYYSYDFSNITDPEQIKRALRDLSVIGALLVFFAFGSKRAASDAPVEVLE